MVDQMKEYLRKPIRERKTMNEKKEVALQI